MLIISDVSDVCFARGFLELLSLWPPVLPLFSQENHWRGSCSFSLHDCRGQFFSIFDRWNFDQTLWNVMQSGIAEDKTSRQNHQNCRGTSPSVYWTNHRCYWDLLTFTWSSSNSQLQIWVELEPFFTLSPSQQAALQRLVAEEPEQWRSPAWRFRYSWLWSFSGYVTWAFYSHKEYQKMKIVGHFCEILVVLPGEIP